MSRKKEELTTQIVDISSSMRSIIGYLDDTNNWLASVGESQEVFTRMMNDPKIESLVRKPQRPRTADVRLDNRQRQ